MKEIPGSIWRIIRQSLMVRQARDLLPNWLVNTFWHWPIAWIAAAWYGFPGRKLTLIGVTGTDGKTTTVYLINHILKMAGKTTAMISSVATEIAGRQNDTGFHITSPHPFKVQKCLKQAVADGVEFVVLEVTSHAIDQHRFVGCRFKVGVLTNVRPDHLDYHKTFENYLLSKAKLLMNSQKRAINKDDNSFVELARLLDAAKKRYITYGIKDDPIVTPQTIGLRKQPRRLPGKYNLSNLLAAAAAIGGIDVVKIKPPTFHKAVETFPGVPGRFEEIETGEDFRVIVDFAHTPYALRGLLTILREQMGRKGKLTVVFGCAAERGRHRRRMGKVAAELADLTVLTSEDPRFEGVEKISEDIASWARRGGAQCLRVRGSEFETQSRSKKHYYTKIPDRQEAINFAIAMASKGDVVALCGKGHEKSMNIEGIEYPWDEKKAVETALKLKFQTTSANNQNSKQF